MPGCHMGCVRLDRRRSVALRISSARLFKRAEIKSSASKGWEHIRRHCVRISRGNAGVHIDAERREPEQPELALPPRRNRWPLQALHFGIWRRHRPVSGDITQVEKLLSLIAGGKTRRPFLLPIRASGAFAGSRLTAMCRPVRDLFPGASHRLQAKSRLPDITCLWLSARRRPQFRLSAGRHVSTDSADARFKEFSRGAVKRFMAEKRLPRSPSSIDQGKPSQRPARVRRLQ